MGRRFSNPPQPGESPVANLRNAVQLIQALRIDLEDGALGPARRTVDALELRIEAALTAMDPQYRRHNPPLVVFSNPPAGLRRRGRGSVELTGPLAVQGVIGTETHKIYYKNADGSNYVHPFEDPANIGVFAVTLGGRKDILIAHDNGKPLWEEM